MNESGRKLIDENTQQSYLYVSIPFHTYMLAKTDGAAHGKRDRRTRTLWSDHRPKTKSPSCDGCRDRRRRRGRGNVEILSSPLSFLLLRPSKPKPPPLPMPRPPRLLQRRRTNSGRAGRCGGAAGVSERASDNRVISLFALIAVPNLLN